MKRYSWLQLISCLCVCACVLFFSIKSQIIKMQVFHITLAVLLSGFFSGGIASTLKDQHNVKWYSCVGKPTGNYIHPFDCNRYMACSEGEIASEIDCATCNQDPDTCPEGMLRWNDSVKRCEWANTTPCLIGGNGTTQTPQPTTTNTQRPTDDSGNRPTTTTEAPPVISPPVEGGHCNPELCVNWGYCQDYLICDKTTGKWVKENCGEDLVWNPLNLNGKAHLHGGNCDIWENLKPEVVLKYRSDPNCLACHWDTLGECEQEYLYQPPGGTSKNIIRMSCAKGLVFSLDKKTCQRCKDVTRKDGQTCC